MLSDTNLTGAKGREEKRGKRGKKREREGEREKRKNTCVDVKNTIIMNC
jgi:hypothetical protein